MAKSWTIRKNNQIIGIYSGEAYPYTFQRNEGDYDEIYKIECRDESGYTATLDYVIKPCNNCAEDYKMYFIGEINTISYDANNSIPFYVQSGTSQTYCTGLTLNDFIIVTQGSLINDGTIDIQTSNVPMQPYLLTFQTTNDCSSIGSSQFIKIKLKDCQGAYCERDFTLVGNTYCSVSLSATSTNMPSDGEIQLSLAYDTPQCPNLMTYCKLISLGGKTATGLAQTISLPSSMRVIGGYATFTNIDPTKMSVSVTGNNINISFTY